MQFVVGGEESDEGDARETGAAPQASAKEDKRAAKRRKVGYSAGPNMSSLT